MNVEQLLAPCTQTDRSRCLIDQRLESVEALSIPQTHSDDVTGRFGRLETPPPPTYSLPGLFTGRDKPTRYCDVGVWGRLS